MLFIPVIGIFRHEHCTLSITMYVMAYGAGTLSGRLVLTYLSDKCNSLALQVRYFSEKVYGKESQAFGLSGLFLEP